MIFENYPTYVKQIREAASQAHPDMKTHNRTTLTCGIGALAISALAFNMLSGGLAQAQVLRAISSVDLDAENVKVQLESDDSELSTAALLTDKNTNLSASDEAKISEQIRTSLTNDMLSAAKGNVIDENTFEAVMELEDGIPVKVLIKKLDDGTYTIQSVTAQLNAETIANKKQEIDNPVTIQAQKDAHALSFAEWDAAKFHALVGTAEGATEEDKATAVKTGMTVLADDVVLSIPKGFAEQETEQPAQPSSEEKAEAENSADAATSANEPQYDGIIEYVRSYKAEDGSTISVRSEQLGSAFSMMNGFDAANKMMGYWKETATSVAEGAGQHIADGNDYATQVFYDADSDMWGYWGHVMFTDDARDIAYDRCVIIDEHSNQMVTISYRSDCAAGAATSMQLDAFKTLFTHAPELDDAEHGAYLGKLEQIKVLAGHDKTIAVEKAEAEAKAQQAIAENGVGAEQAPQQ